MRLLFHCCCGPCSIASVESLLAEGIKPTLFWYNPNIHPLTEYRSRRDSLAAFSSGKNLSLVMLNEYGLDFFLRSIGPETETPGRCEICYRLRLEKTAAYAVEHGFDGFGTSLLISPYQQHETIRNIGEELAVRYGVNFLYRDFRPLFRKSQASARAQGLYMQKYCGCIFSEKEREQGTGNREQGLLLENTACYDTMSLQSKALLPTPQGDAVAPPLPDFFQRLALLTGPGALEKLKQTNVIIFGAGGVGSWCAEALVRSGVGKIGIADFDTVNASNVNRQVQATSRTIGLSKVEVLKQRLLEINPDCEVTVWSKIFSNETAVEFNIEKADYAIDAIDTFPHKLDLIEFFFNAGVTFFSSMGMACKMDPTRIKTGSIWESRGCALARLVRQRLRKRGFTGSFTVVYSDEPPINSGDNPAAPGEEDLGGKKRINGSCVTVTAPAGMALASLVLRDIVGQRPIGQNQMEKR